jgi:nickel/cobalt exporter
MGMKSVHKFLRAASLVFIIVAVLAAVQPISRVQAHPADMYFQITTLTLDADTIRLDWSVSPGPMLAFYVWNQVDQDKDGAISQDEARQWAEPHIPELAASIDQQASIAWEIDSVEWPSSLTDFEVGEQTIVVHFMADWPSNLDGEHQFILYNRFEESISVNWFYIHGTSSIRFHTPEQHNGLLRLEFVHPGNDGTVQTAAISEDLREYWDSGTPTLSATDTAVRTEPPQPEQRSTFTTLAKLLRTEKLSFTFYPMALAVAVALGAIHAVTPGHGKALVGAYLVGSRGTARHAIALGGIVTLTHTGSVLALGVLTLAASHFIMPTTLFPILEMASGLLIVGMGLGLLFRRWRGFRGVMRQAVSPFQVEQFSPAVAQGPAVTETQPAQTTASQSGARRHQVITINESIPVNVYNAVLPTRDFSLSGVQWRSLVTLGISGGLVPCPDAIAILLVAVAINRLLLGLSLIVAFSLGLAVILTAIGIAMVRSRSLFERVKSFDRVVPAMPLLSAVVVIGLGGVLTYRAATKPGFLTTDSDSSKAAELIVEEENQESDTTARTFDIETAGIYYMAVDESNRYQIFTMQLAEREPVALTNEDFGVWDYALSPDSTTLVYSAPREYGGSDLWAMNPDGSDSRRILACPESACTRIAWAPDSRRLVHEKLDVPTPENPNGLTTIWWLDVASGESAPVFTDSALPGYNPRWSPDGDWLSYVASGNTTIQVYNLTDGRKQSIPSQSGSAAMWHPDGSALLLSDIEQVGDESYTRLLRFDMEGERVVNLTGNNAVGDTWASWSPDGEWIAVVRRVFSDTDPSLGDQIWLMRPDGTEAHPITQDVNVLHGVSAWSPDGQYLVYQQHPLAGAGSQPGVWLLEIETRELQQLVSPGNWPTWQH